MSCASSGFCVTAGTVTATRRYGSTYKRKSNKPLCTEGQDWGSLGEASHAHEHLYLPRLLGLFPLDGFHSLKLLRA